MKKKLAYEILVLLLVILPLSGIFAQGTEEAVKEEQEITIWTYPLIANQEEVLFKPLNDKFNEKYPDIRVIVEVLPWSGRDQKMLSAVASGDPPEIAYFNEFYLQMFARKGALLPLDEYIPKSTFEERFSAVLQEVITYEGHIYLAPTLLSTVTPIYNVDILKAAGWDTSKLPDTWDDLLKMAEMVKDYAQKTGQDISPVIYSPNMDDTLNMTLYPLIWQAGGSIVSPDYSKAAFNSPEGEAALGLVKTLFDKGYSKKSLLTDDVDVHKSLFADQKVACYLHPDAAHIMNIRTLNPNMNAFTKAGEPLLKEKRVTYGTVGAWAMMKGADNPEAAAKWIEFITSPDINTEFNTKTGYMSPILGSPTLYSDDPILSVFEANKKYARPGLIIENERKVMDILKIEQQNIVLGRKTVKEALSDAEKQVNAILQGL